MKKQLVLLAFLLLCRYLTLFSQYSVSGVVKDEKGNAMAGAIVSMEHSSLNTTTDVRGTFVFTDVKSGTYRIKVTFLGFAPYVDTLRVTGNVKLNIGMSPRPYLADEVVITAIRASGSAPVTRSMVSHEQIHEQNTGQDVPFLLALTPSAVTTSDAGGGVGYTSIRIRGTDETGINVTVNGIPVNDAESHGVYWVDFPDIASSADNIQIQRGVGTSTQGAGAFGGTINFETTQLHKKAYAELDNAFGSFNTLKNSASFGTGLLGKHFCFEGRLSKITSDGYIDRAWSDLKSYYLSGAYYSERSLLKLIAFSGVEHTYQAWDGVPADSLSTHRTYNDLGAYTDANGKTQYYSNQTDNYQQDNYQMLYSHEVTPVLDLNTALHFTKGRGYYEEYKQNQNLADYGLDTIFLANRTDTITTTDLIRRKWLDNVFYGGIASLNYKTGQMNLIAGGGWNQYFGKHFGKVIWAQYMSNGAINHQYYYSEGTKTDYNVFAKMNYHVLPDLNLFADLQYRGITHSINGVDDDGVRNITQSHTYSFFNPKAGITYRLNPHQSFYVYYGIGNREPTRDDFVDADTASKVKPERLYDLEIGYQLHLGTIRFGANIYNMNYKDQLVNTGQINNVGSSILTNVSKSYRRGLELTFAARFFRILTWTANASFSENVINNFIAYYPAFDAVSTNLTEKLGKTQIAFSPSVVAGNQFSVAVMKNFTLALLSKYVGKQYLDNTQNENRKLNPYFVSDFQLRCHFKTRSVKKIDAICKINNIFNAKYETNGWTYPYTIQNIHYSDVGYFPQAGRNFMVGLILGF